MSQYNLQGEDNKRKPNNTSRTDKLKEIDALYRAQIKQIYTDSKQKVQAVQIEPKVNINESEKRQSTIKNQIVFSAQPTFQQKQLQKAKSTSTLKLPQNNYSSKFLSMGMFNDDKARASTLLKGQSTRTIEILRKQNENKELKIRELSNKCQNLIEKLKKYLGDQQFQSQLQNLKEFADGKTQRLQNLFRIKHQEIFFKLKLQVIALLQEFSIPKEQLAELNDIATQTNLFTFMTKKIKSRLKDFRSKEQESNFSLQKDKILNQKHEQRIHYLTETNQLHKLAESKLKAKVQDLKNQLNEYLQKLKIREQENEQTQNEVFRLKKQNQELQTLNQKITAAMRSNNGDRIQDKRIWEAKQKQMKTLLNNYFVQKQKLQAELQEKDSQLQEKLIKQKFLEQENQRINRQLVRWKQRYQWLQKEKDIRLKEVEQERNNLIAEFQDYKIQHNQGILLSHRNQLGEALRRLEEYQRAYQNLQMQLEEQRRLLQRCEEQNQQKIQKMERQWMDRVKRMQKTKEEQVYEMGQDFEARISEVREEFSQKEQLLSEEMQARMRALLAQKDKKITEQVILLQTENDQLRREIDDLNKIIEVKQSLINVINNKKLGS